MKKFISKIRNTRLKGNVSLLVIFILLACSVIALLSINQIQRLLTYGNMTFNYFRAFYLAKAGTELGLTEVYYREAGFEHSINSGDTIVSGNLVGAYSGFNPYFIMNISGKFQYLTDDVRYTSECSDNNKITLGTGEGIMLSLFYDKTNGIENIITGSNINNINANIVEMDENLIRNLTFEDLKKGSGFSYFTFGLFDYSEKGDMNNIYVETGDDLGSFLNEKIGNITTSPRRYLTIKNPGTNEETVSFCITTNNSSKFIPYSDSLITVRGNYGNMEVGLQSIVKKSAPDWSLNVLGWES